MLSAEALCKSFGARRVVDGVSLRLERGQTLGLLGPNGAGKSTTVAMLCGLLLPDAGRVLVEGEPLSGDADPRKRHIGLVPQELALYETLSARTNLDTFAALYGLSGATRRQRVDMALGVAGLQDRAADVVATYSGGMKRRLNIACALLHEPDALIFDEPTVGVDPQSRNAIFDVLERLKGQGRALLYTTHYMEEAERLCDHIVIMDHGRVLAADRLDALLAGMKMAALLELRVAKEPDRVALSALTGVLGVEGDAARLKVGLAQLEDAAAVLTELKRQGVAVQQFSTARASLEGLFLALTGRSLRD